MKSAEEIARLDTELLKNEENKFKMSPPFEKEFEDQQHQHQQNLNPQGTCLHRSHLPCGRRKRLLYRFRHEPVFDLPSHFLAFCSKSEPLLLLLDLFIRKLFSMSPCDRHNQEHRVMSEVLR